MAADGGRFSRSLFRALQPVEINSWHLLKSNTLRGLANELLSAAAPGLMVRQANHRFTADRFYWFGRPQVPGTFAAGVVTLRQEPCSARLAVALFEPRNDSPLLLFATDRISVDAAGHPVQPDETLKQALQTTSAGITVGRFTL
mmetsp:Transcript_85622/g.169937  ORF Transcript_85622/g.169937 Transcript_85622/m.169937 type:complete len:144 (-) Transcript_85622:53-484(-)